jgi:hypothetical protein
MPKGRHRRHREARAIKRQVQPRGQHPEVNTPCVECGQVEHADWCRATSAWWDIANDHTDEPD